MLANSCLLRKRGYNTTFLPRRHPSFCSLRLVAQDTALSRREQGFETPRERQFNQIVTRKISMFSGGVSGMSLEYATVRGGSWPKWHWSIMIYVSGSLAWNCPRLVRAEFQAGGLGAAP